MNNYINQKLAKLLFASLVLFFPSILVAQTVQTDSLLTDVTLTNAINYAIRRQPVIKQAEIDESISAAQVKSKLADWYPQLNFGYNLQQTFDRQTSLFGGSPVQIGSNYNSAAQVTATQNIFNRDVLLASSTKKDILLKAKQNTSSNKIDLAVNISKSFYDVLSTIQQIKVAETNIARIERSLKDAYYQYQAGITDKTDYKRATITLNNTKAAKKSNDELLKAKLANLKALMNYPEKADLNIVFDSLQMEQEIFVDTAQILNYKSRIEYNQLTTQKRLLTANLKYNKWSYLPSLSANGAYIESFLNNDFSSLYNKNYPNSYAGITLALPIFQGGKRKQNIKVAELQLQRNNLDLVSLENNINTEYERSLALYKSNLTTYLALKENVSLAKEVYDVIELQYRSGIKTYLEVITSESDLRNAQINYYNAIYQLLASKIDVQKALGQINY